MHFAIWMAAAAIALVTAVPAAAQEADFNLWTGQFATINLDRDQETFLRLEAQERFTDDVGRLGQLLLRPALGYRLNDKVSIVGGYAYVRTNRASSATSNEHRVFQELNIRLVDTPDGLSLESRTRLEQRFFEGDGDTALRLRQFLQLRAPISERNSLVVYTEPFFGLNETRMQQGGMDAWRNFAGISVPLARGIELVPGYLNQYAFRAGEDRIDHIANLNLYFDF